MHIKNVKLLIFHMFVAINIQSGLQSPDSVAKAVYKSGEIVDLGFPVTLDKIKEKLKENEVFDSADPSLTEREKKELAKLFEAVEIMTTSRNRQPSSAQNLLGSLRLVERAVKKQVKEGQISETLAGKFKWNKLAFRRVKEEKQNSNNKRTAKTFNPKS